MSGKSAIALLALLFASPAHAASIVFNGDFSAGLAGWTVRPSGGGSEVIASGGVVSFRGSAFGGPGFGDMLWQDLATVPGESYLLSFDLSHNTLDCLPTTSNPLFSCDANYFLVEWDGLRLFIKTGANTTFGPTTLSFFATANDSSTRLLFEAGDSPGRYTLDNVAVVPHVPEPATFSLLGFGLLLIRRQFR